MSKIFDLYEKNKSIILYLFFGGCTTLINIVVYILLYSYVGISNTISNVTALILSILFAFLTNKSIVFGSKSWHLKLVLKEAGKFFFFRALTAIMDIALMFFLVDIMSFSGPIMKILVNVIVVVLNYIFSKVYIFKKES